MVALAVLLATDIFPIITNDSLAYIRHSNSIRATGLVQSGYRQVGYPGFLASVDAIATSIGVEPLLLTALLQRFLYLGALAFAAWLWRWRALPLITLAIVPSAMVYPNLILTEGLGVGLALWCAVLTAWIFRLHSRTTDGEANEHTERRIVAAGVLVAAICLVLAMIRFHYLLACLGLPAVLYAMYRTGAGARKAPWIVATIVFVLGSGFFFFASVENAREVGPFFPSVRGERSQFWAVWQITFTLTPENRAIPALTDLYADGDPYRVMSGIDALPDYDDQQAAYEEAIERLIDGSGTSLPTERLEAFAGVLRGGRIDDIHGIVDHASRTSFTTVEDSIYRMSMANLNGIDDVTARYNDGRPIRPVLISPLAPVRTFPYFTSILQWLVPVSALILLAGIAIRETRLLSVVGLLTLLATASVFGYFLMDNVRFVLTPLLFVVAIATGVADAGWRHFRHLRDRGHVTPPMRREPLTSARIDTEPAEE